MVELGIFIIFMVELGIWVLRACANFIRGCHVFLQLLVTVENDDVSTELIRIFIIELGIWVIRACANFIRGLSLFFTAVGYCRK